MDDFTVHGDSFDECLHHLTLVPRISIETNLVLNLEKSDFMIEHGVVLEHVVSTKRLEVDKAKVDIIQPFSCPQIVREVDHF